MRRCIWSPDVHKIYEKEEPIEAVPNPTVVVQTPETGNIELSTGLTGTVEPADQVYIIPKGSGEVLEVYVNQEIPYRRDRSCSASTTSS